MLRKYTALAELKDMLWEIVKGAQQESELLKKQLQSSSAPETALGKDTPFEEQLLAQVVCL